MNTIAKIRSAVDQKHLLKHPFYQDWSAGKLRKEQLADYAKQYYAHVRAFPRYVSATHARCASDSDRQFLLQNLMEEEYGPENHLELWLRFAEGLGLERGSVLEAELYPETRGLVDTFLQAAQKSYGAGLGVLYAYESQVPDVARSKIDGLQQFYGISDAETLRFFTVHEQADVHHSNTAAELIEALPAAEKAEAEAAAAAGLAALNRFLDGVQARAGKAAS